MDNNFHQNYCQTIWLQYNTNILSVEICLIKASLADLQTKVSDFLHPEEFVFYNTLLFARRQKSYLLGRYTAKFAIARVYGEATFKNILLKSGIFEYPVVVYPKSHNIQVTISHSDNASIALAFPEELPFGVDLEEIQPKNQVVIESQLTLNEKKLINNSNASEILATLLWTIKEALSKVLRTGMTTSFEIYAIKSIIAKENYWLSYFENFTQYQAISFVLEKYICSIVCPKQINLHINITAIQHWIAKWYQL